MGFLIWKDFRTWSPSNEYQVIDRSLEGICCRRKKDDLMVICSILKYQDGNFWCHTSMSYRDRMPDYKTMCEVKDEFIGEEVKAIQVFAPKSEHVNIHPYCLHLYSSNHMKLPDFRIMGQI